MEPYLIECPKHTHNHIHKRVITHSLSHGDYMILLCWTNQTKICVWSPCDHNFNYPPVGVVMGVDLLTNISIRV